MSVNVSCMLFEMREILDNSMFHFPTESTIVALLERLYDPNIGAIKFGNVDLKNMSINRHRERIGLVTQDPVLFSGEYNTSLLSK